MASINIIQTDMQNIEKRKIINLLWSFFALVGFVKFIKIGIVDRNFSNNIVYLIIYISIFAIIEKTLKCVTRKTLVYGGFYALILSIILIVGAQIEYLGAIIWTWTTVMKIVMLGLFLIPFISLGIKWCIRSSNDEDTGKINCNKWKIFVCICAIWGLAYLALFPGIYDYDSIDQTLQFLVTGNVSAHHPVLHSFLLSAFLKIGDVLFDSYQIGLGIYSLVQLVFLAFVAVEVSWFLYKKQCTKLFYLSLLFYMCFPLHYIMAVWAAKDIFFTGFFVLVSLMLIEIIESRTKCLNKKSNMLRYLILVIIMCMLRNNGIYALIVMIMACFFVMKRKSVKIIVLTFIAIGIYTLYQNAFLPMVGVVPGNMREMLSIPCQQLAKVYVETPEVYTNEEKKLLLSLIPEENIMNYQYRPMISDATKNYFNTEEFKSEPTKYIKMYLQVGLKSPRKYIEAFLTNSLGFWYPNKSYPDDRMYHPYMEFNMADPELFKGDYIYIKRSSKLPMYERFLSSIVEETKWEDIPIVSNLFVPGTYFLMLCFALLICIYQKKFYWLTILGYWLGLWLTLLISPVALIRYAYPIIFCVPLLGYIICGERSVKKLNTDKRENILKDEGDRCNG